MLKREANRLKVKNNLMDAAETLFSKQGYDAVSVRQITQMAETRLADITDYFGGKEQLFQAVVARRANLLNHDYESKLNMLNRNGSLSEQVNALVSAFISPLINRGQESPAWMNYLRLLSRNNSLSLFSNISDFSTYFQPIKEKFTQELAELFPASSEKKIFSAYQLMSSCTMSQLSSELEIEQDLGNTEKILELEKKMNEILNFVKGGILELLNEADQNLRHSHKVLR